MEKKSLKITVIMLLFFFLPLCQHIFCKESSSTISWKFEPHVDRSLHIEAVVLLTEVADFHKFLEVPENVWIKNIKAHECTSGDPLEHRVYYDSTLNRQVIELHFAHHVSEPLNFSIEFDLIDFMEETPDRVFILDWQYKSEEEEFHTGAVFLPKGAELLDLKDIEPKKMEEGEQVIIHYEEKSSLYHDFTFHLAFSSSGRDYVRLAKGYEESQDYDLAFSCYQKALSLYARYRFYVETNPGTIQELRKNVLAVQKILADYAFEDAQDTFDQGEYEKAKTQFENVEAHYRIMKDTEKESQCRAMIMQCDIILLTREGERLLEEGKAQYKDNNIAEARKSFNQAKSIFEEVKNTEKLSECEEWLDKLEFMKLTVLVSIFGIIIISLALWYRTREHYDTRLGWVKHFYKHLISIVGIFLFSLGLLFQGIFLETAIFFALYVFFVWVGYQHRKYVLGRSHSFRDCFVAWWVTLCIIFCTFSLGFGIIYFFQSALKVVFFLVYFFSYASFFVLAVYYNYKMWGIWGCWGLLFKKAFRVKQENDDTA